MYLSEVFIENFRGFGAESDNEDLKLPLRPGLNVLVGENDSGKSAIIDAIRIVLTTRSQDYYRISDDDFHVEGEVRATAFRIRLTFRDLTRDETSRFLEWLSIENNRPTLILTLAATRSESAPVGGRARRTGGSVRAGKDGNGPLVDGDIREFLQATYLRPLRDAETELSGGKGSRLAQILLAHPDFKPHESVASDNASEQTLVGIIRKAEEAVQQSPVVRSTATTLNQAYLSHLGVGTDRLTGQLGIARDANLRHILEKLELWLAPPATSGIRTRRGLGSNNLLFMAAELLLLGGDPEGGVPLLLIEEPEAHLHPQLQSRLIEFLEARAVSSSGVQTTPPAREDIRHPVQILVTTHSPNLAAHVDIQSTIVVAQCRAYPLDEASTRLSASDYGFLRRFLDVTKANLFFARGVLIVEGTAESLLLPAIARKLNKPLSHHGVSIVNVGSRALLRYARIFLRADEAVMPVRVACLRDRDIIPEDVNYVGATPKTQARCSDEPCEDEDPDAATAEATQDDALDLGAVKTFVSPWWTLEYDIARAGFAREMLIAVRLAMGVKRLGALDDFNRAAILNRAERDYAGLRQRHGTDSLVAAQIYKALHQKRCSKAVVAQYLAEMIEADSRSPDELRTALPAYLVEAIDYAADGEWTGREK